jgi:hypothetical protein
MPEPDLLRPIETAGRIAARASRHDKPCWSIFGQVDASGNLRNFPQPGFGWQEMSEAGAKVRREAQAWGGASTARPVRTYLRERPYPQVPRHGFDERQSMAIDEADLFGERRQRLGSLLAARPPVEDRLRISE